MTKQTSTVLPSTGQTNVPAMNQSTDPGVAEFLSAYGGEKYSLTMYSRG